MASTEFSNCNSTALRVCSSRRLRRHAVRLLAIGIPLALLVGGVWLFALPTSAQGPNEPPAQDAPERLAATAAGPDCSRAPGIPRAECDALLALYRDAGGTNWLNQTNWGQITAGVTPCDWFGVTCAGGHVTQLSLTGNNLQGALPAELRAFGHLTSLLVADNHLREIAPSVCQLASSLEEVQLDHNQLRPPNGNMRTCLDVLDAGWSDTQTTPPRDLTVTAIATSSIQLTWQPIRYTEGGGYYEVSYAAELDEPFVVHGQTADKGATGYVLDGLIPGKTYRVRVRTHTPEQDGRSSQWSSYASLVAATRSLDQKVLLALYAPMDNDLSPYLEGIVRRVQFGTRHNPNVQAVMLADARGDQNTRIFEIADGIVAPTTIVEDEWGASELDTTDPEVLAWFLQYVRATYPASRTVVSLMGHGIGLMPEFDWLVASEPGADPQPQPGIPALPRGIEATPGDVTDGGGYMSTPDFRAALAAATDDGANPIDLLFFDQCFQGNLDVLYELHDLADVIVASPNYAWLIAAYHKYLAAFNPADSPELMAQAIVTLYQDSLTDAHPNAILWVRGDDIPSLAGAASDLAEALRRALAAGQDEAILGAAQASQYVDTTQCGRQNLHLGPPDELLGAGTFALRLREAFGTGDAYGISAAADALLAELSKVSRLSRVGSPYLAPDEFWDYRDAVTLLAPLQRDAPSNVAWRASIYQEATPLTAVWTPVPTQTLLISSTFRFVRDGAWDDFIADWYTGPATPTVGEWCAYIPPVIVSEGFTETLALDLEVEGQDLQLRWSNTTADDATGYWILAREQTNVSWIVLDVVPLTATSYTLAQPQTGGAHLYAVVAQDDLGVTVAQSNEAVYSVEDTESETLYLPFLQDR